MKAEAIKANKQERISATEMRNAKLVIVKGMVIKDSNNPDGLPRPATTEELAKAKQK